MSTDEAFLYSIPDHVYPLALKSKNAAICAWNHAGSHFAVGGDDGTLAIWDIQTLQVSHRLLGHAAAITSISWSSNDEFLLTGSADWNIIYWHVPTRSKRWIRRCSSPITLATISPASDKLAAVCSVGFLPCWLEWDDEGNMKEDPMDIAPIYGENGMISEIFVGNFDDSGEILALGTSLGRIAVMRRTNGTSTSSTYNPIAPGVGVRDLAYDKNRTALIVNCNDKTIRYYHVKLDGTLPDGPEAVTSRFRDLVELPQWTSWLVSPDGEQLLTAPEGWSTHTIFVWDIATEQLVKKMDGPRDGGGIVDMVWHPFRPLILALTEWDLIFLWTIKIEENWTAFAPGFIEIDDNREYQEAEDEFDMAPEHIANLRRRGVVVDNTTPVDEIVDVITV